MLKLLGAAILVFGIFFLFRTHIEAELYRHRMHAEIEELDVPPATHEELQGLIDRVAYGMSRKAFEPVDEKALAELEEEIVRGDARVWPPAAIQRVQGKYDLLLENRGL